MSYMELYQNLHMDMFSGKIFLSWLVFRRISRRKRKIIISKYLQNKQWYVIADEENYSEKWCKNLRNAAINKLAFILYGKDALTEDEFLEAI